MIVDDALIKQLAQLSRLDVDAADLPVFAVELRRFLGHAQQILQAQSSGDAELLAVAGREPAPLREDRVAGETGQAAALANAPQHLDGMYVVPRVLE